MGWNYNSDDEEKEKKVYPTVGSVTLSTEEYRDMWNMLYKARRDADKEHDDWHEEYTKRTELERQIKKLNDEITLKNKKLNELTEWIAAENLTDKFKLWRAGKLMDESNESEEE